MELSTYNADKKFKRSSFLIKFLVAVAGDITQRIKYDLARSSTLELWTNDKLVTPAAIFLKEISSLKFNSLMDFSFQDYIGKKNRFLGFYVFLSYSYNVRACLFTQVKESQPMISLTNLFNSSSWMEREAWDMFGVYFVGNRFMVRLLTDYGFVGFPLRKDFPLTGFKENFYDYSQKKVVYDLVELMQELRVFSLKVKKWA